MRGMSLGRQVSRLAFWRPVRQVSRLLLWLFKSSFALLYAFGLVCWFTALYTMGHHLEAVLRGYSIWLADSDLPLVACMFLMFGAASPSRFFRVLLVPLVVAIEMIFLFTGHYFLFYKIGALFSTGFLLILYGEKIAMRRRVLKQNRPDHLDRFLDGMFGVKPPFYSEGQAPFPPSPLEIPAVDQDQKNDPIPGFE
jgi:hypothetical protein